MFENIYNRYKYQIEQNAFQNILSCCSLIKKILNSKILFIFIFARIHIFLAFDIIIKNCDHQKNKYKLKHK